MNGFLSCRFNDLDVKGILEQCRVEDLVVIVPFVTNLLMSVADSVVFRPPNPWTMVCLRAFDSPSTNQRTLLSF